MLLILTPTTVHRIIALAEAYGATRRRDWSDVPGAFEMAKGVWHVPMNALDALKDETDGDPVKWLALCQAIKDLSCEEQAELTGVMWVGRRLLDLAGWERIVQEEFHECVRLGADAVATYIGGKWELAQYLRDGLRILQRDCESQQRRRTNRRRGVGGRADRRRRPAPAAPRRGGRTDGTS